MLKKSLELLKDIQGIGLFKTIEMGKLAGISRPINGGKGLEGVIKKDIEYYNPFMERMLEILKGGK